MSVADETEIIAYIHELLEDGLHMEMKVLESDYPEDSPVIVIKYKGSIYAIAVEELHLEDEENDNA
jgi:hypothetical protein